MVGPVLVLWISEPVGALLPHRMLLDRAGVASLLYRPPPLSVAVLLTTVLLITASTAPVSMVYGSR